ncbi:MAG: glycosyltransferase, partial [Clostridia bacterium]
MAGIALTGGGTAGHIMPCLALLPELKKKFDKIIYLGGGGMEKELAPKYGLPFFQTEVIRLERLKIWKNIKIPFVLKKAAEDAAQILEQEKIDVVFSKGGYAALPCCFAAKKLKIPLIVHESDYTMGVANKLTARFARHILTSFPETKGGEYIGNPIREEILAGDPERARAKYRLSHRPLILVFGGSLGAEAINRAVYAAASQLVKTHTLFHITGKSGVAQTISGYTQTDYADDIADLYALA